MKYCKWCGSSYTKLAKSHIIPKAFVNFDGMTHKLIISNNKYRKRTPTGLYDYNLLCYNCESYFGQIDSLAADVLLNGFSKRTVLFNDERDHFAFQINGSNFTNLKKFLISVLWRASVTDLVEFKGVRLGPYEKSVRESIMENKIFDNHDYSFMAYKIEKSYGTLFPFKRLKSEYEGMNYYCLPIANYIFDIKVDSRKSKGVYKVAAEHPHAVFIKLDTLEGNLRDTMRKLLIQHESKFGKIISY